MSNSDIDFDIEAQEPLEGSNATESSKYEKVINEGDKRYKLTGMYKEWYLDYASYVI